MDDCCGTKAEEIGSLGAKHKNILINVLMINAALFVVEAGRFTSPFICSPGGFPRHVGRLAGLRLQVVCSLAQRGVEGEGRAF